MQHSFNIQIAMKYGVHAAIILNNIYFWVEKNKANNKNFYDGHYWTFNSKTAFAKLFPYMTPRQIEYALKKLVDDKIILTGNYNSDQRDRTLWYSISKTGYILLNNKQIPLEDIPQNCEMEQTKLFYGTHKIVQPLPYINTNINSDLNSSQSQCQTDNDFEQKKITKDNYSSVNNKNMNQPTSNYKAVKELLQENIEYDLLIVNHPFEKDLIDELLTCMLDICLSKNKTIKIKGEEKNIELVKSVYLKINFQDIEHILYQFKEINHKITHISSYLKTMLFLCKEEHGHFYTNAVRADGLV